MSFVRVSGVLSRRVCGTPAPAKRLARAGLLLPDRSGKNRKTGSTHGSGSRVAEGRERLYHYRDRSRLTSLATEGAGTLRGTKEKIPTYEDREEIMPSPTAPAATSQEVPQPQVRFALA